MASHNSWTVDDLFLGKPIQLKLYNHVRAFIEPIGPVKIKVTKTQVSFANKRQFAWIWLPMEWSKKRPPNSVVLSFALGTRIANEHIVQSGEPYPGRWMHHVIVHNESGLSETTKDWLRAAYQFGAGDH